MSKTLINDSELKVFGVCRQAQLESLLLATLCVSKELSPNSGSTEIEQCCLETTFKQET